METIKITEILENPSNPRHIKATKLKQLIQSITDFEDMLKITPIVVDENNVILGGNMRYRALKELGYEEVEVHRVTDLTEQEKQEFIIKDNVTYGDWEWGVLMDDFNLQELQEFGLNPPKELFDQGKEREVDESVQITDLEIWLNKDEKYIKMYFTKDEYELVLDKLKTLREKNEVESNSDLIMNLLVKYYQDNKLKNQYV